MSLALAAMAAAPAFADCGQDMQKLGAARNGEMEKLNNFFKSFKGKPADPEAACERTRGLMQAEQAMLSYMEKNKDWCSIPDEAIANFKANHAKSATFAAKACTAAAQMRKMKEQAAKGEGGGPQAQPLPAGPL
ncbi:hypothetical protein DFR50_14115 [Roseiarcus fermentans]|uniref:Uncharacterized protein n=1 Tax=Roseiarcus fermentans TaxID=1473586 RepID=A0A366ENR3_9HYPH|nr:hypothetical protein DFR50_14115 [Roseiarcus fermentans]